MDGELISPNRDLLIAYMGWYQEVNHEEIHLDTIKWETHADHEVLYWKRLPLCLPCPFQGKKVGRPLEGSHRAQVVPRLVDVRTALAQRPLGPAGLALEITSDCIKRAFGRRTCATCFRRTQYSQVARVLRPANSAGRRMTESFTSSC
jgi:hypothetical protein